MVRSAQPYWNGDRGTRNAHEEDHKRRATTTPRTTTAGIKLIKIAQDRKK